MEEQIDLEKYKALEEPIDLEKYKEFLDIWSKFTLYNEKTKSETSISEAFSSFINFVNSQRRFKYHQHDASEYNNIWEKTNN